MLSAVPAIFKTTVPPFNNLLPVPKDFGTPPPSPPIFWPPALPRNREVILSELLTLPGGRRREILAHLRLLHLA